MTMMMPAGSNSINDSMHAASQPASFFFFPFFLFPKPRTPSRRWNIDRVGWWHVDSSSTSSTIPHALSAAFIFHFHTVTSSSCLLIAKSNKIQSFGIIFIHAQLGHSTKLWKLNRRTCGRRPAIIISRSVPEQPARMQALHWCAGTVKEQRTRLWVGELLTWDFFF